MSPRKRTRPAKANRALIIIIVVAGAIVAAAAVFAPRATSPVVAETDDDAREADRHYVAGLAAYRQQDWRRALMNFQAALSYEPEHFDAREHLNLAQSEERVQQTLERASAALEAGRAEEAIALATTIPESSVYSEQAAELRRQAQAGRAEGVE